MPSDPSWRSIFITLPSTPISSNWSLSLAAQHQNPVHSLSTPISLLSLNIFWGVQMINLPVTQPAPLPCYLVPLRPKYLPQYPQPTFLPQCAIFYFQISEKITQSLRVKYISFRFNLSSHENRTVSGFACMGTARCSQGHKHNTNRVWVPPVVRRDTNTVPIVYGYRPVFAGTQTQYQSCINALHCRMPTDKSRQPSLHSHKLHTSTTKVCKWLLAITPKWSVSRHNAHTDFTIFRSRLWNFYKQNVLYKQRFKLSTDIASGHIKLLLTLRIRSTAISHIKHVRLSTVKKLLCPFWHSFRSAIILCTWTNKRVTYISRTTPFQSRQYSCEKRLTSCPSVRPPA
jgi:hypothetical protein